MAAEVSGSGPSSSRPHSPTLSSRPTRSAPRLPLLGSSNGEFSSNSAAGESVIKQQLISIRYRSLVDGRVTAWCKELWQRERNLSDEQKEEERAMMEGLVRVVDHPHARFTVKRQWRGGVPEEDFLRMCEKAASQSAAVDATCEWARVNSPDDAKRKITTNRMWRLGCLWNERGEFYRGPTHQKRHKKVKRE